MARLQNLLLSSLLLAGLAGCYLPAPADEGGGDDTGGGNTGGGNTGGGNTGGGNTGGGNTGGGNTGGGNTGGGATYYCCLNGQFFGCGTEAAVDACFLSFDPSGCDADPSQNATCDDGGGNTGGGGGGNTGGGNTGGAIGDSCQYNDDCSSRTCVVDGGMDYGVCSDRCESFADCPTFWDCVELGNATGTYCVPG